MTFFGALSSHRSDATWSNVESAVSEHDYVVPVYGKTHPTSDLETISIELVFAYPDTAQIPLENLVP